MPSKWHRYGGEHDCWAAGCDLQLPSAATQTPPATSAHYLQNHACPVCAHPCMQLERDLATFMRSGSFHPDAVRGTSIDPNVPPGVIRQAEAEGMVVGVKGTPVEPYELARQLRDLADVVDREGQLRDTEHARRLGLAVARALGPRWSQRRRMLETDE